MKLKHILQYFGLLALLITTLLGSFYLYGKNAQLPSFFVVIILVFSFYYLVRLLVNKKEKTHQRKERTGIFLLFIIYLLMAGFSGLVSNHFITVQLGALNDLENNGNDKLETIITIQKEFDKSVNELERELTMEINNSLLAYNNAPRNSLVRQEKKYDLVNIYKFPESVLGKSLNNKNIKQTTANWIESNIINVLEIKTQKNQNQIIYDESDKILEFYKINKDVFNKTDYTKISNVYYQLDTLLPNYKQFLENEFQKVSNKYNLSNSVLDVVSIPKSKVQLNSIKGLWESYSEFTYVLIYLLIHFLILFPFFMARRKGVGPSFGDDTDTLPL